MPSGRPAAPDHCAPPGLRLEVTSTADENTNPRPLPEELRTYQHRFKDLVGARRTARFGLLPGLRKHHREVARLSGFELSWVQAEGKRLNTVEGAHFLPASPRDIPTGSPPF